MGLYQVKEFLTFEDLAEYLSDKEVFNFSNIHNEFQREKLKNFIVDLVQNNQLRPVFYYKGLVKEGFETDSFSLVIEGYIYADKQLINDLLPENTISLNRKEYLKVCKHTSPLSNMHEYDYIFMDTTRYKDKNPLRRMENILSEVEAHRVEQVSKFLTENPDTLTDDISIHFSNLQYPKSDLEILFNKDYQYSDTVKSENAQLKAQIADLETQLKQAQSSQPNNNFDILLNPNNEYHAPDLKHAIQLWLDLYSTGKIKDDSHSNLAEQWIAKNTNYDSNATSTTKRIREITTPLKDFGAKRSREPEK